MYWMRGVTELSKLSIFSGGDCTHFSRRLYHSEKQHYPFNDDTTVCRRAFSPIFYSAWIFSIGVKFSPTTAPRIFYTVKKKISKILKTFLILKVLVNLNNFYEKNVFWYF